MTSRADYDVTYGIRPFDTAFFGEADLARARELLGSSRSVSTRRQYTKYWAAFLLWCRSHNVTPLPADPNVVALYLADMSRHYKYATLKVVLAAIGVAHFAAEVKNPSRTHPVKLMMRGIARTYGTEAKGKAALTGADIRLAPAVLALRPNRVQAIRDHAILTVGFAAALRCSDLRILNVEDITLVDGGLLLRLRSSKTDQERRGESLSVARGLNATSCPVAAMERWLSLLPATGPLFRRIYKSGRIAEARLHKQTFGVVVKRYAGSIDRDPRDFGSHSMRIGFVTTAYDAGVPEGEIMAQTRHSMIENLRRYLRPTANFRNGLTGRLGL